VGGCGLYRFGGCKAQGAGANGVGKLVRGGGEGVQGAADF
jgi:hypothetical protein